MEGKGQKNSPVALGNAVEVDNVSTDSFTMREYDPEIDGKSAGLYYCSPITKGVVNVVCSVMGAGILGLPKAVANAGWWGILILILVTIVFGYTGHLIHKCLNARGMEHVTTYAGLGQAVAGRWGKRAVLIAQVSTCLGISVLYLVVAGQNLYEMFEPLWGSRTVWTIIAYGVILPTLFFKSMKEIAVIALFGAAASIIVVFVVIAEDVIEKPSEVHYGGQTVGTFSQSFATIAFSFGAHAVFPAIARSMPSARCFPYIINISFPMISMCYLLIAAVSYWAFGNSVEDNILLNLEKNAWYYFANACITAHVMMAFTVYMNPFFYLVEIALGVGVEKSEDEQMEENADKLDATPAGVTLREWTKADRLKSVLIRFIVISACLFVALLIPFFGDIMSFIGGSTLTFISAIIPCWFHLKLFWGKLGKAHIAFNFFVIAFATVAGAASTYYAVKSIINNASTYHLF
eukprot:Nk52_evm17s1444 gene=Nk52_evmTU17s1444